jgi:hypothetical protein
MTHATHANATLTPTGRLRLARLVVVKKWTLARAAERFSVSITTARRWAERYRAHGVRRGWVTDLAVRVARRLSWRAGSSGASWGCGSAGGGDRPGSPTTWV